MIDFKYGITLDIIVPEYLEQMIQWRNNKAIWSFCRQSDLIQHHSHLDWFDALHTSGNKFYAMFDNTNKLVGICGLASIDWIARRAEFSLYVGPECQRMGHATNGLKTLFRHGFENLNLNLIWGESIQGNPAIELFKKLGMVVEGVRREFYWKDGAYKDATLFSIKRSEIVI